MSVPGRTCPTHYRYSPGALAGPAKLSAETLYVVGGLYGNRPALAAIGNLRDAEAGTVKVVFNGDFNWFNVDAEGFEAINTVVFDHIALRGNVETELAIPDAEAGCGCAYPDWVTDAEVERSNEIMARLRETAQHFPELRKRLAALPMHMVVSVGGVRVGIVHGDAQSLAGWGFSHVALSDPEQRRRAQGFLAEARVSIFASTHTCLPVLQVFDLPRGEAAVINNGAAGMPNFLGTHHGLITRIATHPPRHVKPAYGARVQGLYVHALPVHYDVRAWRKGFLANWTPGSAAYESYFERIVYGPAYRPWQAMRRASSSTSPRDGGEYARKRQGMQDRCWVGCGPTRDGERGLEAK